MLYLCTRMKCFRTYLWLFIGIFTFLTPLYTKSQPPVYANKGAENAKNSENVRLYELSQMSQKLGIPFDSSYNPEILWLSCEWVGVPYAYGFCSKNGTDCSGFAQYLYKNVYQKEMVHSSAGMYQQCVPVKKDDLKHGDLLFFKIYKNRISHVGVFLGSGYFIHASTQKGVIISHLDEPYYKRTYYSGGRVKNDLQVPD